MRRVVRWLTGGDSSRSGSCCLDPALGAHRNDAFGSHVICVFGLPLRADTHSCRSSPSTIRPSSPFSARYAFTTKCSRALTVEASTRPCGNSLVIARHLDHFSPPCGGLAAARAGGEIPVSRQNSGSLGMIMLAADPAGDSFCRRCHFSSLVYPGAGLALFVVGTIRGRAYALSAFRFIAISSYRRLPETLDARSRRRPWIFGEKSYGRVPSRTLPLIARASFASLHSVAAYGSRSTISSSAFFLSARRATVAGSTSHGGLLLFPARLPVVIGRSHASGAQASILAPGPSQRFMRRRGVARAGLRDKGGFL